jgi:DNA polymerase III delta subunit
MTVPLAYYFGDDDLMLDRAVGRLGRALAGEGEPLERWNVRGGRNDASAQIGEIHGRVATPVMFGGGTLAVVANPGALAVRNEDRDALLGLLSLIAPGNALVFTEAAASGAKEPGQKKVAEAVRGAGGEVRRFESPKEGALAAWIDSEARDHDVRLAAGAAKELATRIGGFVREGDAERRDQTRRAAMEIDKLALYRPTGSVSVEDVRALVAEAIPGSAWALADAVAERDGARALDLFESLVQTMPEPVIVVVLHRRIRELLELLDRMPSAKNLAEVGRAMKINSSYRMERLATQARRWQSAELIAAIDGLLEVEATVKGAPNRATGEAHRRLAFSLWVADHVGVSGVRRTAAAAHSR